MKAKQNKNNKCNLSRKTQLTRHSVSIIIATNLLLSACGGSSSGENTGDSLPEDNVINRTHSPCGIELMERELNLVRADRFQKRDTGETPEGRWNNPKITIYNADGSGAGKVRKSGSGTDDNSLTCVALAQAFGSSSPLLWQGPDGLGMEVNDLIHLVPKIEIALKAPAIESYKDWEMAGRPQEINARVHAAKLEVEYWSLRLGETVTPFYPVENQGKLSLNCPNDFSYRLLQFSEPELLTRDLDSEMCQFNASTGRYDCLEVRGQSAINQCDFSAKDIYVPDEFGGFHRVDLNGSISPIRGDDYRLRINQVTLKQ